MRGMRNADHEKCGNDGNDGNAALTDDGNDGNTALAETHGSVTRCVQDLYKIVVDGNGGNDALTEIGH